jgi:Flp pilus assembly protein CpaB
MYHMKGVIVVMVVMLAVTVLVSVVLWKIVAPRVASALAERLREDEDTKKWIASLQAQVPGEQNKQPQ